MERSLNHRARALTQSPIRAMSIECRRYDGINLAQGICDTAVPAVFAETIRSVVEEGHNSYSRYDGVDPLRAALARKMREYGGIEYDPEGEIVVTCGATGAFYVSASALLEAGDEVILFEPYYGYHVNTLYALDVQPVLARLEPPDWALPMQSLERAITKKTRALVINTPANPCGKVFTRDELATLGELAERHDLWILTDEVYEHFLYEGARHVSPASVPGMRERTITMSSLSKTFAVTGWRLGWLAADRRWAEAFGPLNDLYYVCAPTPLQMTAAHALETLGREYYENLAAEHEKKRDRFCGVLDEVGLTPHVPRGAYYVLADASRLPGKNGWERAMHLLREHGVASVPGEAFLTGGDGASLLRFCFGKTDEDLEEACRRLRGLGSGGQGLGSPSRSAR